MKNTSVITAFVLILILITIPVYILKESLNNKAGDQSGRLHWQTGNTTRITSPIDQNIAKILYPSGGTEAVVLVFKDTPLLALAAVGLRQPILYIDENWTETLQQTIKKLAPRGLTGIKGTPQIVLVGPIPAAHKTKLTTLGYRVREITNGTTEQMHLELAQLVQAHNPARSDIIIGRAETDPTVIIPAGTLLAHYGIPLLLADTVVSKEVKNFLENWSKSTEGKIYFIGTKGQEELIPEQLEEYAEVETILGKNAHDLTLKLARYYDPDNLFGWWASATPEGGHNMILTNPQNASTAAVATLLAAKDKFGPMLYTDTTKLPLQVEKYYWEQKPDFWMTPAEGPYNHTWIIGDAEQISYPVQGRVDFFEEIAPYDTFGPQGMSGLEVISLLWILSGLLGAVWIFFHLFIRQPSVSYIMKLAWILVTLMSGPVGIWGYYLAYKGYDMQIAKGDWRRPLWVQALVSTLTSMAYGTSSVLAITFLLNYFALPLSLIEGPFFLLGNVMFKITLLSYAGGFLINMLLFVPTMLRMGHRMTYGEAIRQAFFVVLIAMTAIVLGIKATTWWGFMEYLSMMPEESDLLWLGGVFISTLVGLIVAYPGNWLLVRSDAKKGRG